MHIYKVRTYLGGVEDVVERTVGEVPMSTVFRYDIRELIEEVVRLQYSLTLCNVPGEKRDKVVPVSREGVLYSLSDAWQSL